MQTIKVAMLAGKPHVGKSCLTRKLTGIGYDVLASDSEIMKRLFDLFPQEREKELHRKIGTPDAWKHLYDYADVDRLMRLHHRDWLARHAFPTQVVAEGWIYVKRHYRKQLYDAFAPNKIKGSDFRFRLVHYLPPKDVCAERHAKSIRKRLSPDDPFFARSPEDRRQIAEREYDNYVDTVFEPPTNDEPVQFETISEDYKIIQYLADFFAADDA